MEYVSEQERSRRRGWSWPPRITRVPDLLRAVRSGFDLVIVHGENDQPIYKLRRDGELSPPLTVAAGCARSAHSLRGYFGHGIKLDDGSLLLKLTTKAPLEEAK